MTKKLSVVWATPNPPIQTPPVDQFDIERQAKLNAMIFADQTDGIWYNGFRHFVDQAAAQEWLDFMTAQSTKYSNPIVLSEISDI